MKRKNKILYYTLIFICIKGFIGTYFGHDDILNLLTDLLVIYIAINVPRKQNGLLSYFVGKLCYAAVGLFFAVGIVADIVNLMSPITVLWGVKMVVRYFLLMYCIMNSYDATDLYEVHRLFYKLFYLNVIACVFEFFTGIVGDFMGGTFRGNGELAIYVIISLLVFSADYYSKNSASTKKSDSITLRGFIIRVLICFWIAMAAEIKFLYLMGPIAIYASYVLVKKFSIGHIITLVAASFFLIPAMQWGLTKFYGERYANEVFDADYVERETSHSGYNLSNYGYSFNRSTCITMAEALLLHDPLHKAIGYGIGSGNGSNRFGSWIIKNYAATAYYWFTSSYVLIETGWIGYIAFILGYVFLMLRFWRFYNKAKSKQVKYWMSIGLALCAFTFMFIWYNATPYTSYYVPYLIWGLCIISLKKAKKKKKLLATDKVETIKEEDKDK